MTLSVGTAAAAPAQADPPAPLVRLEYHAAPGCPSATEFQERIEARAGRFRVAGSEEDARTFVVTLRELSDGGTGTHRGELVVHERDGATSARGISGASCEEVAAALSVIIAIELNPELEGPDAPPRPPAPAPAPEEPEPPFEPRWRAGVIVAAETTSALSDHPSVGGKVSLELRRESDRLLAPAFRFGLSYASGAAIAGPDGEARLLLFGPTVEGCPVQARFARRRIVLEPCGTLDVGFVFARGSPYVGSGGQGDLRAWAALGGVVRLLWAVREPFFVEAAGGPFAPLVRDTFYIFTPSVPVFEPPAIGWRANLGVGIHFL